MGMSHDDCDHPRTPASRAACRKDRTRHGIAQGMDRQQPRERRQRSTKGGIPAGYVRTPDAPRKAASEQLKRPGTYLRNTHDLADVPRVFSRPIHAAWDNGWHVRVGERYNDLERRVELLTPYGVVSLVWRDSNPNGVHGVFWRRLGSSTTHRIDNVNQSIRLGAGEETL